MAAPTIYPPPSISQATQVAYAQAATDMNPFEARNPSSAPSSQTQSRSSAAPPMPFANMGNRHSQTNHSSQHSVGYTNYFRSFSSNKSSSQAQAQAQAPAPAQIYTAVYSSVPVYEMEIHGIAVMRRRSDSWLNATQILKVAGVDKGKRTKILEKEILSGPHEKIQGGYGKYQGTWIDYNRGREFCRQYGVEETLRPLLDYDLNQDGSAGKGQVDTPTKEQAMAANRKKFYNTGIEKSHGSKTFFENIGSGASTALAAMHKAHRMDTHDSPLPRPASAHRQAAARKSSHQSGSQDPGFDSRTNGMVHDHGFPSKRGMETAYAPLGGSAFDHRADTTLHEGQEPPRKRLKPSSSQEQRGMLDPALEDDMQTEVNDSFVYDSQSQDVALGPLALSPLLTPTDKAGEEKRLALLDLFADSTRTDFTTHTAILHLSGQDLDIPLDGSANTALHWAATLARVPLLRLLILKGADIFRGNAAGQNALMAAVQVNNSLDHGCFPEMLEIFGPLVELRDATGRTVLHHIAISSGIRGRSASSRYYLESLLEFVVRQGAIKSDSGSDPSSTPSSKPRSMGLARFMSHVVNVQDKSGNTALNLVARIGNRALVEQLAEVGADYTICNKTGFAPVHFGVTGRPPASAPEQPFAAGASKTPANSQTPSQLDQIKEEIFATTTSILTQTQSRYTAELQKKQSLIDASTAELAALAGTHKTERDAVEALQRRARDRADVSSQIFNLQHALVERPASALSPSSSSPPLSPDLPLNAAALIDGASSAAQLPPSPTLRARLVAHRQANTVLERRTAALRQRSRRLEARYRKVVALCTGVGEEQVDGMLDGLLAAVESEGGEGVEVGRVRDFLRMVDFVQA